VEALGDSGVFQLFDVTQSVYTEVRIKDATSSDLQEHYEICVKTVCCCVERLTFVAKVLREGRLQGAYLGRMLSLIPDV
jgi:hypothetical protein